MQLHAKAIRIPTPNRGFLEISAPVPEHMLKILRLLGLYNPQL